MRKLGADIMVGDVLMPAHHTQFLVLNIDDSEWGRRTVFNCWGDGIVLAPLALYKVKVVNIHDDPADSIDSFGG